MMESWAGFKGETGNCAGSGFFQFCRKIEQSESGVGGEQEHKEGETNNGESSVDFSISTSQEISTSDYPGLAGSGGDLFVSPMVSILFVEVANIFIPANSCRASRSDSEEWALVGDSFSEDVQEQRSRAEDQLDAANSGDRVIGSLKSLEASTSSSQSASDGALKTQANSFQSAFQKTFETAYADGNLNAWNSHGVHSLFDIVMKRIPDLEARKDAAEALKRCWVNYNAATCPPVGTLQSGQSEGVIDKRIKILGDAIDGWYNTLRFYKDLNNEALKYPMDSRSMFSSDVVGNAGGVRNQLQQTAEDSISQSYQRPETPPDVNEAIENFRNQKENPAFSFRDLLKPAREKRNRITFTGGGQSFMYAATSSNSLKSALSTGSIKEDGGKGGAVLQAFLYAAANTVKIMAGGYKTSSKESSRERSVSGSQSYSFKLSDPEIGDYFDVEVFQDPVYNTPVFRTVAGVSRCPHELGTAPRELFSLELSDGLKRLQVFSNGEASVPFPLTINNQSPTKEDLGFFFYVDSASNNFIPDSTEGGDVVLYTDDGINSINSGSETAPLKYGKTSILVTAVKPPIEKRNMDEYNGIVIVGYSKCEWDLGYPALGLFNSPDTFGTDPLTWRTQRVDTSDSITIDFNFGQNQTLGQVRSKREEDPERESLRLDRQASSSGDSFLGADWKMCLVLVGQVAILSLVGVGVYLQLKPSRMDVKQFLER